MSEMGFYEIVAVNERGEERASIKFNPGERWEIAEFVEVIDGWFDTDKNRKIFIRLSSSQAINKESSE